MLLCVWASLVFQTALHLPALFSFRYSVLALDMGLCVLAGLGVARMLAAGQSARFTASSVAFVCLASLGAWHAVNCTNFPQINLYGVPRVVEQQFTAETLPVSRLDGMAKVSAGRYRFESTPEAMEIDLSEVASNPNVQEYLVIDARSASEEPCNEYLAAYRAQDSPPGQFGPPERVEWISAGEGGRRALIGGYWKLGLPAPSALRLSFACPIGSELQITKMELIQSRVGYEYRAAYLRSRLASRGENDPPE